MRVEDVFDVLQYNGQRIFEAKNIKNFEPSRGSEIYVGNLPKDFTVENLILIFGPIGSLYKIRFMVEFNGECRGFAFVTFFFREDAQRSVLLCNGRQVESPTRKSNITVQISLDNCQLFLGNLPRELTLQDVRKAVEPLVDGLKGIVLYPSRDDERLNRGYAFLDFENHAQAAVARRKLFFEVVRMWETAHVDWAEPEPFLDSQKMNQVTKLYLSNLPTTLSSENLRCILSKVVDPTNIIKVHKINDYAFVHFTIRKYAEQALVQLKGSVILGRPIGVEWARPIEYSKHNRAGRFPENFCRSVPPSMRRIVMQGRESRNGRWKKESVSPLTDQSRSPTNENASNAFRTFDFQNLRDALPPY